MGWKYTKEIRLEKPSQPDPKNQPSVWAVSFVIQTKENRGQGTLDSGTVQYDVQKGRIIFSDFHDHDLHNQVRFSIHKAVATLKAKQ
ncbi:MAG TPA: hypothetical protein PLZ55_02400 [bacterium]|nr:hypothetical protein [bacterium]HPO07491.1 hypothetical protein [bacterium]HQO33511.1 hypothetical protein [bacterium]HQP99017.1 hypothetical protein [bacterium]